MMLYLPPNQQILTIQQNSEITFFSESGEPVLIITEEGKIYLRGKIIGKDDRLKWTVKALSNLGKNLK